VRYKNELREWQWRQSDGPHLVEVVICAVICGGLLIAGLTVLGWVMP